MSSFSLVSAIALIFCLGLVQCQSDFDFDDRDFVRGRDNRDRIERERELDLTVPECREKVMDIFFVLDSSTSIWINDVEREREFVRQAVRRLDVGSRATRVGILTFSDDITRPALGLSRYQVKSEIIDSINVNNIPYRTGRTATDTAIRYVRENTEFRQDITKVIVVVTDGGSLSPGATAREAQLAREAGFYLFVVGVGQYLDEREWRAIASDPDENYIYNITDFRFLNTVQDSLPTRACGLPPIILGYCDVQQPADLFFTGTSDGLLLLDNFVDRSGDDSNFLRLGLFLDVCNDAENIGLNDVEYYCDRALDSSDVTASRVSEQLNRVRAAARSSRDRDLNKKQVAVLFLDEETLRANRFDFNAEARSLERDGVELVVVDLGVRSFANNVQDLPLNRENYVRFSGGSLVAQQTAQRRFLQRTCDAVNRFVVVAPDSN